MKIFFFSKNRLTSTLNDACSEKERKHIICLQKNKRKMSKEWPSMPGLAAVTSALGKFVNADPADPLDDLLKDAVEVPDETKAPVAAAPTPAPPPPRFVAAPRPVLPAPARKTFRGGKTAILTGKRFRRVKEDPIKGVSNPAIRRLARKAGITRICGSRDGSTYESVRRWVRQFLKIVLGKIATLVEGRGCKTVQVKDVVEGLRRTGIILYSGFD
jgi:histone H4